MSTPEGKVKDQVKKVLAEFDAYWHMPVQNGMGAPSLDFICCVRGFYFAIETKAPGGKPTPRQEDTMDRIRQAGGKLFVIDGDTSLLVTWLREITR